MSSTSSKKVSQPSQPNVIESNESDNSIGFDIDSVIYKPKSDKTAIQEPTSQEKKSDTLPSLSTFKKPALPPMPKFNSIGSDTPTTNSTLVKPIPDPNKKLNKLPSPPKPPKLPGVNSGNIVTSTPQDTSSPPSKATNTMLTKLMPDMAQSNYFEQKLDDRFADTNQLLTQAINQSDYLFMKVEDELDKYKKSPTFGGKSRAMALSTLLNTQANILGTKISAIKEANAVRKSIVDNVLKRDQMQMQAKMKIFAPKDDSELNTDKAIADAYYSIINASRYGLPTVHNPLAQSSINTGINLQGNIIPTSSINAPIVTTNPGEMQPMMPGDPLNSFLGNNMSPNQKRMILEHNPNVKIVVFYDQSTGGKKFEALDVNTGKIIPGVQLPASFLLEDMRIDFNNALAYNSSANLNYPLVIVGHRAIDEL